MKKHIFTILILIITLAVIAGCGSKQIPVIGISQFGEHPSLDNCREGFLQGLAEAGLKEDKDFSTDYQNAGFDPAIASQIAQNFSSANVTLMVAFATPSATACFAAAWAQACATKKPL